MSRELHILHKKTAVANKVPSASTINYGEIAINYNDTTPGLFIRTDQDNIERFVSGKEFDAVVGTGFGTGGTITEIIEEDEKLIAAAANDLNRRKYEKPASGIPKSDLASNVVPDISTNVAQDKNSNSKTASAKAVYDEVHPSVIRYIPSGGFLPNVVYQLGTISTSTTFTLASPTDNNIFNQWYWSFETPSTPPVINWPHEIRVWSGSASPVINGGRYYEISVVDGIGKINETVL